MHPAALTLAASLFVAPPASVGPHSSGSAASIKSVFHDFPSNLRRLAARDSAITASVAGAAALIIGLEDAEIARSTAGSTHPNAAFEVGDMLGTASVQVGSALGTLVLGQLARQPALAGTGADLLGAQLVNGAITETLKYSVRRRRPNGGERSFPSGHTSATFATASVLHRRFGWKIGPPAFAAAAYVGASRLHENEHYLSDVVVGAAVGIVAGRAVKFHTAAGAYRGAVVPLRGGAAVVMVYAPDR